MEANRSRLLAFARPYLQLFSLMTLTPPPVFFERTSRKRLMRNLKTGYCCYALGILLLVIYATYVNIVGLYRELNMFHVEDSSMILGSTQKGIVLVMTICNHLNMLLNYQRLGAIYEEIVDLEADIERASGSFDRKLSCWSFRYRLAIVVGLWMVVIMALIPHFSFDRLGPFVSGPNKALIEIVMIMAEFKGPEYCVFVLLIYELLLRVRHTLQQVHQELEDCQCRDRLQELCVDLKQNQLLVGRIWRLVGELGSHFTLGVVLLFLYNGVSILHMVNWAIIKSENPLDRYNYKRLGAIALMTLNLLLVCYCSDCCTKVYNSIPRILSQIRSLPAAEDFPILKMGLREYFLQMQHLKLLFTCSGFIDISLKHFGGMLLTFLGYIIILVQFKMQAFAETKNKQIVNSSS